HSTQSVEGTYTPASNKFSASDFNYNSEEDFKKSPEYQYIKDNNINTHTDFLKKQGVTVADGASFKDEEKTK
ncbi:vcrV domain protein, partial [Vibrio parahaemolyticus V-223/04]